MCRTSQIAGDTFHVSFIRDSLDSLISFFAKVTNNDLSLRTDNLIEFSAKSFIGETKLNTLCKRKKNVWHILQQVVNTNMSITRMAMLRNLKKNHKSNWKQRSRLNPSPCPRSSKVQGYVEVEVEIEVRVQVYVKVKVEIEVQFQLQVTINVNVKIKVRVTVKVRVKAKSTQVKSKSKSKSSQVKGNVKVKGKVKVRVKVKVKLKSSRSQRQRQSQSQRESHGPCLKQVSGGYQQHFNKASKQAVMLAVVAKLDATTREYSFIPVNIYSVVESGLSTVQKRPQKNFAA